MVMRGIYTRISRMAMLGLMIAAPSLLFAKDRTELQVGAVISLTGQNARGGTGMHEGMQTAVKIYNERQSKYRVRLITVDDESAPAKVIAGIAQLSSQKVLAIAGGATSDLVAPAASTANKVDMVYITSGGTSEEFVQQGYRNFFRINNTFGYVKAMTGLFEQMGVKKLSVVYSTQKSTYELARDVTKVMEEIGVEVELHPFDPAIRDFKPVVNKVKLLDKPDVINVLGYENDYIGFLRAARILKPNVEAIVGVWQIANAKMASEFPDLVQHISGTEMLPYPVQFTDDEGIAFEKAFKELFNNKSPDYLNEYGYVQTILLIEAIERAAEKGDLSTKAISHEMRQTDRVTLTGRVVFEDNGDNPYFMPNIGQHQNGKVVLVYPDEASNGEMVKPGVPW